MPFTARSRRARPAVALLARLCLVAGPAAAYGCAADAPMTERIAHRTLKVWELGSGRAVTTLKGHTAVVTACAITPDGRHVVSASEDQTLKVWELGSERAVATFKGHTSWVKACAVTPDGRHMVSASEDQTLKVWEP